MILTCPSCESKYLVDAKQIGNGRHVKCTRCNHTWYYENNDFDIKELEIVDLGNSSSYETPKNIVGHIPQTVNPGEKGKSWYFGHLESFIKKEGNVFHMLPKIPELMKSDPYIFIHIKTNSKTFVYQIYKTQVVPKEELVLDIESEYPEVILVTCVPSFLYHSRLLIYSKLIGTY